MALEITHQDDSPLTGLDLTVERGTPSAIVDLKIFNAGEEAVPGAFVVLYAETAPGSGTYASEGQPVVDERMGRFQITGQDSSATAGQEIVLGVVQPLGHLAVALLPTILPGDWILADLWLEQGGASAGGGSVRIKIEVAGDMAAYPIPFGVSQVGTGIDSGRKQPRSFFIADREVTATGTPDDEVHAAAGEWLIIGEEYADGTIQDAAFNQNDGAAEALTAGQVYLAVLTQSILDAPTVTKGLRATSGSEERPTPPAGEILLAWVTVAYSAGATVIAPGDIEDARVFGRYKVTAPATGLSVTVSQGEAIIDSFRQVKSVPEVVALTATAVNRVWLEWSGAITVTLSDILPSAGAVKLADATTDGANVTDLSDNRTYIRPLDAGSLQVKETDGDPDVLGVTTIRFPPDSVTNDGSGQVTIAFPGITGKADNDLAVTATEGVQRTAGTDLTTAVEFTLDVNALTEDAAPDTEADWIPTFDDSAGTHKKILVGSAGGVSLGKYVVRETPTGVVNGSNPDFELAFTPAGSGQEHVFLNGLVQDGGVSMDYTIAGTTITFNTPPESGDKIRVTYFKV